MEIKFLNKNCEEISQDMIGEGERMWKLAQMLKTLQSFIIKKGKENESKKS